jgi:F420-dependent methylenetetrahydromethanopterin dehydrogenase
MDASWASIKRDQAREADHVAIIASGIGEYGIANACFRLAAILHQQAREIEKSQQEQSTERD